MLSTNKTYLIRSPVLFLTVPPTISSSGHSIYLVASPLQPPVNSTPMSGFCKKGKLHEEEFNILQTTSRHFSVKPTLRRFLSIHFYTNAQDSKIGFCRACAPVTVAQNLMSRYNQCLSLDATIMVSRNYPIIGEHVVPTLWPAKTPTVTTLGAYNSKTMRINYLYYQLLISMMRQNFRQS